MSEVIVRLADVASSGSYKNPDREYMDKLYEDVAVVINKLEQQETDSE